ncbi:MAG TPA: hypothetical protein VG122_14040, partial [Gemmata sp.]|nr:hypothetical protein [Gemmata sp.]
MSDFGVAVVRGWVTNCVALMVVGLGYAQALAQPSVPIQSEPPTRYTLPTDGLVTPAPAVPPRMAYQPIAQVPDTPVAPDGTLKSKAEVSAPKAKPRKYRFTSRYGDSQLNYDTQVLSDGTRRFVFTDGVIVNATGETPQDTVELAADQAVVWIRGIQMDSKLQPLGSQPTASGKEEVELYLSGNVIIRTQPKVGPLQTLRGSQIYYDMDRERAIAIDAEMEYRPLLPVPGGAPVLAPDPVHFRAIELRKLDAENYEGLTTAVNTSKLPSDPGLQITAPRMTMTDREVQLRNVFGIPYTDLLTGQPVVGDEKTITAYGAVPKFEGIPFFYFPWYRCDANEPLGPFVSIGLGENRIFGAQLYSTWNMFELVGLRPPIGMKWTLELDYLSERGPGFGSDYKYHLPPSDLASGLMGADGLIKYYGIPDHGLDDLGGNRGPEPTQPGFRERFLWRHQQEFTPDLFFQGQLAYLSDKNFLEQYYKSEFDTMPNQETFANLTWQQNNYLVNGLIEPHVDRPWIAETSWLPRVDGALIGQSFLDRIVYSGQTSVGYAMAHPTETNPVSILPTDQKVDTGRFDFLQELSVPFGLGPVQVAPYALLDLTGYSSDLAGNPIGRVWGGGGVRTSMAASHLYEGVTSDLFNIRDLYHKMVFSANYLYAETNVHYNQLPMLDRLNDDATDQAWRNITPMQSQLV